MFDQVKQAIADVEASENAYESALASNGTAQLALTNAQATAAGAAAGLLSASGDVRAKAEALKTALTDFESTL